MHKLLRQLLQQHLPEHLSQDTIGEFINELNQAFEQHDKDRSALERSLKLTSGQLNRNNDELRQQLAETEGYKNQLEESLVELGTILNATPEAIFSFKPNGDISQINNAGCDFLGAEKNVVLSSTLKQNIDLLVKKLKKPDYFLRNLALIEKDNDLVIREMLENKQGRHFECYSVPKILDNECVGRVWCLRDVTDLKRHQEELRYQAFHDTLTGLANRALVLETILHAITLAKRNDKKVAILFIDLDNFKKVNDTAGHEVGDKVLIAASERIASVLRESDLLGRLGGDEFVAVLEGVNRQRQVMAIQNRVLSIFRKPFEVDDNQYVISCSIGVSSFPQDGSEPEELIRKADMAMYEAKKSGKNRYHYFDESLERIALHRVLIENQLRDAIGNGDFVLHFQPKICMQDNNVLGVEALIRWQKSEGELVYPDKFIPVAEDTGLIKDLTQWVFREVCSKISSWQTTVLNNIPVSINISAIDFSDEQFITRSFGFIEQFDIDSKLLEIELTESVFFDNINQVKKIIAFLKKGNMQISIDDFGTGYSSFSYLHDLDVDYLKIDRSFVQGIQTSEKSLAIIKSIIDLGINLGIKIVAEGVETESDHQFLMDYGCHIGQGYYYARPLSEEKLFEYMSNK